MTTYVLGKAPSPVCNTPHSVLASGETEGEGHSSGGSRCPERSLCEVCLLAYFRAPLRPLGFSASCLRPLSFG